MKRESYLSYHENDIFLRHSFSELCILISDRQSEINVHKSHSYAYLVHRAERRLETKKSPSYTYLTSGPFFSSPTEARSRWTYDVVRKSPTHRRSPTQSAQMFLVRAGTSFSRTQHTRTRRRDVTDQCCRGVARPFTAVRGSRALGHVRPRSGRLARSYGEDRQLLFDTRAGESVRV